MAIKTRYLIGEKFINNIGLEYEIVGYCDSNRRRVIQFKSGFKTDVSTQSIIIGKITDYGSPTIFGVGILGDKKMTKHPLFMRWMNMIGRCYYEKHAQYKSYGGKGVIVEDYLKNFKNYIEFISSLDGYENLIKEPGKYQIDKDILNKGCNNYNRENLKIVLSSENLEEENSRRRFKINMIDLNGNIIRVFNSITEAEQITGIHRGNIARTVRGQSKTAGGYVWERVY